LDDNLKFYFKTLKKSKMTSGRVLICVILGGDKKIIIIRKKIGSAGGPLGP
jgi:hypothetical protein